MKKATIFFVSNTNKNQYYKLAGFIFFILWAIGLPFTARATLRINSVTPDHGPIWVNTPLTINGEGFSSEDRVAIWGGGTYIKASHATKGPANALDCSGSYAYLACGTEEDPNSQGIQIFNIQDPSVPLPVKFFTLPDEAKDIVVIGNYAYVAAAGAGLQILDVQNPGTPSLISSLPLPGKAIKLCVYGTYVYIAAKYAGLHIIDISDLHSPKLEGSYPEYTEDVLVEGNYAYLAAGDPDDQNNTVLEIIDIHDPQNPAFYKSYETSGKLHSLYKRLEYLYLSKKEYGVEILNVTDPNSPKWVSNITALDTAFQVCIKGDYLYVADGGGGIKIFDHDPNQCTLIGFEKLTGSAQDLQVFDNTVFVANDCKELQILDAENPHNPSIASIVVLKSSSESDAAGLHLYGDRLYVFSGDDKPQQWLKILDISDPQNPVGAGFTYEVFGTSPKDLVAGPDCAYLVSEDRLEIFTIDSGDPTPFTNFTDSDYIDKITNGKGICIKEDTLFLAASLSESIGSGTAVPNLIIFSLNAYPADPYLVDDIEIDPNFSVEAIYAMGDYLILAKGKGGLEIFNILDPSQPTRASGITFDDSYIKACLISGDYVYLADHEFLRTVNIADPSNPDLISSYMTTAEPQSLTSVGDYLYLAEGQTGIEIVDVSQSEGPRLMSSLPTLTRAEEVVSDGAEYVYLAMENGIMVIRALKPCPEDPTCVNATTLTVSTPMGLAAGTYNISVAGPDGSLAVLPNGFTIEGNRPPVFIEPIFIPPLVYLLEGEEYSFSIIASDPDGDDPLSYSVSLSKLPGANLNGNVFSWTPIVGSYPDVLFTVSDGEFTVEQEILIMVEEAPDPNTVANSSPELFVPSSPQAAKEGIVMSFLVEASDPNPEDLTTLEISMLNAPPGAELQPLGVQEDKMAACFLWTPNYQQAGDYTITFIAKDQHSSEDQEIVSINIQDVSSSPQVNFLTGANFWLCPAGRSNYSSFDFLKEHGEEAIYSLHAYDWDLSLLYSSYWFFGKPSGGNFSMDKSLLYVIYTKKEISFNWPLNL